MLEVVLTNNYFIFDVVIYQQINGLGMGINVSTILENLYTDYVEAKALSTFNQRVILYARYEDDAFLIVLDHEDTEHIVGIFNEADIFNFSHQIRYRTPRLATYLGTLEP